MAPPLVVVMPAIAYKIHNSIVQLMQIYNLLEILPGVILNSNLSFFSIFRTFLNLVLS